MNKTSRRRSQPSKASRQWKRIDLHLHTPGSADYQEPHVSYLDILKQAELRGLDIIAFTDHNTVAGYAALQKTLEQLNLLEQLGRIDAEEQRRLDEYRRLLRRILLLPGFEFTATFGFHILGIFAPDTPVSYLEHLLLMLNVPTNAIRVGSAMVGATSDVLTAYRIINEAGGLVIAAHANSGNGVIMRGLDFGGQTRIAYTQDPNLHALEVTDLEKRGRYGTRAFFDGSKPEYPRPMRCIQGSDAHRVVRVPEQIKVLGIGDRTTEVMLSEVSFEALAEVIKGNDLSLTRPYRGKAAPFDFLHAAREEGATIVQSFHERMTLRGGHVDRILEDVCAMANTNGGTVYVGISANPKEEPVGVRDLKGAISDLQRAISTRFSPEPEVEIDSLVAKDKNVVRITIQPGADIPYALDNHRIYVRDETDTNLAVRDEIVRLVERRQATAVEATAVEGAGIAKIIPAAVPVIAPPLETRNEQPVKAGKGVAPPSTGVEIVESKERGGTIYHTVHDLRNGNRIKNVTRSSARKLWHYAISQAEAGKPDIEKLEWHHDMALISKRQRDEHVWYDLAMREGDKVHVYFGVTDSGLNDDWMPLLASVDVEIIKE